MVGISHSLFISGKRIAAIVITTILYSNMAFAQFPVKGRVLSADDNTPLPGVNVILKNRSGSGTVTDVNGQYRISVPSDTSTLVFSFVGFTSSVECVEGRQIIDIYLVPENTTLNEIVVTGYGTQTQKDLTGSIASAKEKDFNKGNFTSPDQLIQGRVAGVQITNSSGQPGVAATIKIRGNSVLTGSGLPLFVVDGVPLSGASARPNSDDGDSPVGNPLNFINPNDILSIDVLKDASATAIYGSRAAYGVVMITTKKGQAGDPQIDVSASVGISSIQNRVKVLDGDQYRQAIPYYGVTPGYDKGANVDGLGSILRQGKQQNYSIGISGGNNVGKYRFSMGYYDQEGILLKSDLKRFNASLVANMKFLESKRLGLDVNVMTSQYQEQLPIIRNQGSLVGAGLMWNPTDSLRRKDGSLNILTNSGNQNPLALSEGYNDNSKVTTILASLAPRYEFTDWLEAKILTSINYSTGNRRNSFAEWLDTQNHVGSASVANNENLTTQLTGTLTFHKDINPNLNLNAVAGYEFMRFTSEGSLISVVGPANGFGNFGLDYTNYLQYSNAGNRNVSSFSNPVTELQSYFGRAVFNFKKKYLLTATFRADGSSKFGTDNKYGYFPSLSAAWVISDEEFFQSGLFSFLKVRAGWGKTGNQEFPAGSSSTLYSFYNNGAYGQTNNPNPNLKWQADQQINFGIDFAVMKKRLSGTIDFFQKTTTDLLYPTYPIQPAPPGTVVTWVNLDGKIQNKGVEVTLNANLVDQSNFAWTLGINAMFIQNSVSGLSAPIYTGYATSGAMVQVIQNGSPINTFHTRKFIRIEPTIGQSVYEDDGNTLYNFGSPNPTSVLGLNTMFRYKRASLTVNMYGAFGHYLYNNTLNGTLNVSHINASQNIALQEFQSSVKESVGNPVQSSSRYIEKGDYLKMGNATLSYNLGNLGKGFKQARVYFTAQNLFTITKYSGFNPEVNTDRNNNGVPSLGIDNQAYPVARSFILGFNFTL